MTDLNHYLKRVKANEAVERMKGWFEKAILPERVEMGCLKIDNVKQYVETAFSTLEHAEVLSIHFRAAYIRLFSLKQHLEKQVWKHWLFIHE